ncbi:MAG: response regulator [Myxococcota bacterium]
MRILFVNNDPTLLAGLRAVLRKYRQQWQMSFVTGPEAFRALQEETIDVVVAELDVEGPLGGSLLELVAEEHPSTVRVVLSASADLQQVMRVVPHAHQYVSMPVEPSDLVQRIERSEALRRLLDRERVKALGGLNRLPTHHRILDELRRVLRDPEVHIDQVGEVIEQDPAMSAKILQLVNSAFFSRNRRIMSIREAVSYLGLNLIEGLVLQIGLVSSFEHLNGISLQRFQIHGLQVATVARRIAPPDLAELAFTTGLVHDVGKLVLSLAYGSRFVGIAAAAEKGQGRAWQLERDELGVGHPEAGAYVLGVWGLPTPIVEGVAWHHQPNEVERSGMDVVAAVHLADAIAAGQPADDDLVNQLDLQEQLEKWRRRFDLEAV